jgi:hypothetical protein
MFPWAEDDLQRFERGIRELATRKARLAAWRVYICVSVTSIVLAVGLVSPARWPEGICAGISVSVAINMVMHWRGVHLQ